MDEITTVEQFNALPVGSVVLDNGEETAAAWQKWSDGEGGSFWGNTLGDAPGVTTPEEPDYPLTLLFRPDRPAPSKAVTRTEYRELDDGSAGVWTDLATGQTRSHMRPATRQARQVTEWVTVESGATS